MHRKPRGSTITPPPGLSQGTCKGYRLDKAWAHVRLPSGQDGLRKWTVRAAVAFAACCRPTKALAGALTVAEQERREPHFVCQMFKMASLMYGKEPMGSACAPPSGSRTISSITPAFTRSGAVIFSASVACRAKAALSHHGTKTRGALQSAVPPRPFGTHPQHRYEFTACEPKAAVSNARPSASHEDVQARQHYFHSPKLGVTFAFKKCRPVICPLSFLELQPTRKLWLCSYLANVGLLGSTK